MAERIAAFSDFYRAFVPTLIAFLRWQGARLPDAADIAQETMAKAYRSWERIEHPESWVRTVASREYARRIASLKEDPADDLLQTTPLLPLDFDVTAFEERHEVLQALELLPPRQRQIVAWTYDGYAPTEIGQLLGITPEAVRSSLLKARRTVAGFLARSRSDDD